ncbi:RAD52 family DNA repair protein [Ruegeria sp.]|uniref:RAD52 family DNA repair protein n=1 Tax=Ruegeria sp. TaxID=1879320 RepID=UPI003B5C9043
MDWEKVTAELKKPLDASAVRPPAPGKFGEYVDGKHVIDEANRIFGHDGWSYEVTRLQQVSEQTVEHRGKDQYRVGYLCTVKVNIDGVIREGTAVGSGVGNPNSVADHHESAVKEAETDALKRALRTFGNTFGLALYEKDKDKREVSDPNQAIGLRDQLKAAVESRATAEDLASVTNDPRFKRDMESFKSMDEAKANEVSALITQQENTLSNRSAA